MGTLVYAKVHKSLGENFIIDDYNQIITEIGVGRKPIWYKPWTWFDSNWPETIGQAMNRINGDGENAKYVVVIHYNCYGCRAHVLKLV